LRVLIGVEGAHGGFPLKLPVTDIFAGRIFVCPEYTGFPAAKTLGFLPVSLCGAASIDHSGTRPNVAPQAVAILREAIARQGQLPAKGAGESPPSSQNAGTAHLPSPQTPEQPPLPTPSLTSCRRMPASTSFRFAVGRTVGKNFSSTMSAANWLAG